MQAALLALDWGTTSLRAFLLAEDGTILQRQRLDLGILKVPDGDFAGVFRQVRDTWPEASGLPALACGMIGSRQGWVEAPYCPCPAGLDQLATRLEMVPGDASLWIVPGLSHRGEDGLPDVMRGEETQLLGLGDGLHVLPGTHSKWAQLEKGRVLSFLTCFTGELYGLLRDHSILGRLMEGEEHDAHAFQRGLSLAARQPGLLHQLFSVRSLPLGGELAPQAVASYLSGLLIGTELSTALDTLTLPEGPITVVGAPQLTARYREALSHRGLASTTADEDSAARGLYRIATAAGLLEKPHD